jgi:hypothetical protein
MNYSSSDNYFTTQTDIIQQANHVLQTPAYKPMKTKLLNLDTKFQSSDTGYGDKYGGAVFNAVLPQRITEIQSISVRCLELPVSFNNFSKSLENTFFTFQYNNGPIHTVTISDQFITSSSSLLFAVNTALSSIDISLNMSLSGSNVVFSNNHLSGSVVIKFNVDSKGNNDKNNFKNKLGWVLGFRMPQYTVLPSSNVISESYVNTNTVKYVYLALQENPNQGNPNSFISPLFQSYINKDILARVTIDSHTYSFGSLIPANLTNGYLVTDKRTYSPGKLALQNLQLQLLTDNGTPIHLNGQDFSFVVEIEHF